METNAPSATTPPTEGFQLLPLELIDDPQRPLRSDLTPESVTDLVLSIKQMGIIEPIIVRPAHGRYEVIAGHRRFLAASIVQLTLLPTIVKDIGDEETEIIKKHPPALKIALAAKKNKIVENRKSNPLGATTDAFGFSRPFWLTPPFWASAAGCGGSVVGSPGG